MSDYRRHLEAGGVYFFTLNLEDRGSDALVRRIGELQRAWRYVKDRHPFETIAAATMPDHMHFVWRLPHGETDYPTRIRLLKAHFTRSLVKLGEAAPGRRVGERDLWQRRFWEHTVRNERELTSCVEYVHGNPVKHGHVGSVEDWPYSTCVGWRPGG